MTPRQVEVIRSRAQACNLSGYRSARANDLRTVASVLLQREFSSRRCPACQSGKALQNQGTGAMSFFSPAKVETPAVTGSDLIRRGLAARMHKGALGRLARDYGTGVERLESYARNEGTTLPAPLLQALAKEFFNAGYDAERDLLTHGSRAEPVSMGLHPPLIGEMSIDRSHLAPREPPQPTTKPQPKGPAP